METQAENLEYERVAGIIERQIDTGAFRAAERVPSLRSMSRHAGVSIGTVVQAYLHLEQRGLLEARPRSGYFVAKRSAQPLRSEEHTSELQSLRHLVCRLLLEKKKQDNIIKKRQ